MTNLKKFVIIYIKKVKNTLNLIIEYLGEDHLISGAENTRLSASLVIYKGIPLYRLVL